MFPAPRVPLPRPVSALLPALGLALALAVSPAGAEDEPTFRIEFRDGGN